MLVYTDYITPRLEYVAGFIRDELFNSPVILTCNKTYFEEANEPKINYSTEKVSDNELLISPAALLFEKGITDQLIEVKEYEALKIFFTTREGDYPFDIFAAIFYLLSRYEEYLPHTLDEYGRYAHINSLAFRQGFLQVPLINQWLQQFKTTLREKFPSIQFRNREMQFIPTYDIDIAWCYKYKGFLRNTGSLARYLVSGKWKLWKERVCVLLEKTSDPYDVYEWLEKILTRDKLSACYFFIVADALGKYDKNIHPGTPALKALIKKLQQGNRIGLHPSWQSGDNPTLVQQEKHCLEQITQQPVTISRQHYIRFTMPVTFRKLIEAGITRDYSMGYGSINGFRASVASPFYWYDLEKEQATSLQLLPFCFMDANAYYEEKLSATQALEQLSGYYHVIKSVGGLMIGIWHNNLLANDAAFMDWRTIHENFLKYITISKNNDSALNKIILENT